MSKKLYEEVSISDIANAIREKNGTQNQYTVAQMSEAVRSLEVGEAIIQTLNVTQNGTYNPPSGVDGFAPVTVNVSGGSTNILSGEDFPAGDIGNNGDIYLRFFSAGIKNTIYGQCINTGYSANTDSKLVCDFLVTEAQKSEYPTIFGARPNSGDTRKAISWHMTKGIRDYTGAIVTWQNEIVINGIGATKLLNKFAHVELKNGLFTLRADGINVEKELSQVLIDSSTPIYLFNMGINGNPSSFGQTNGIIVFRFSAYENDVLVHDFVPKIDTNNIVCIHDIVSDEYKYPNTGTMKYIEGHTIYQAFYKVNGAWQPSIGSIITE